MAGSDSAACGYTLPQALLAASLKAAPAASFPPELMEFWAKQSRLAERMMEAEDL